MIEDTKVTIADVARYILDQCGEMTTMKLQKLCYYSQVWNSYLLKTKLFKEEIQAWSYGPVSYDLFELHRGKYQVVPEAIQPVSPHLISKDSYKIIDEVLKAYGKLSGSQLSDLSHSESPWVETRKHALDGAASPIISVERMFEFAAAQSATK